MQHKIIAVDVSCSLLTISSVAKTNKGIKMCLYWHVHNCTMENEFFLI